MKRYVAIATLVITILSIAIGQTTDEKLKSKADARKSISGGKQTDPSPYLFLWAGDADKQDSDFLAVVDARSGTPNYGRVITTLPVGVSATMAHHTEHEMPEGGVLFANGFAAGQTFRFDLRQPEMPRLLGSFKAAGGIPTPTVLFAYLTGTYSRLSKCVAKVTRRRADWSSSTRKAA